MVILGINSSHNATACLLIDGNIVGCVSEERLTRIKNQSGLPQKAIKEVLKLGKLGIDDVDFIALNTLEPRTHLNYAAYSDEELPWLKGQQPTVMGFLWRIKELLYVNFPSSRIPFTKILDFYYETFIDPKLETVLVDRIEKEIGIPRQKIVKVEHHLSHILPALLVAKDFKSIPYLLLSLDSLGDKLCATVSVARNGTIKRVSQTLTGNSIGDLYAQVTAYLGMKMGEHEYKVMGLAPYASKKYYSPLLEQLKKLCWVNKDLSLETKIHSHLFYKIIPKILAYQRFDNIAGSVQELTEQILCDWIQKAVKKTNIPNVAVAGGVFMNVKANQKILELDEVKNLTVMPSSADESTAIGAALAIYLEKAALFDYRKLNPITSIYFGGESSDEEIKAELNKRKYKKFKITSEKNIEQKIANLLSSGEIVARFKGKMEWGARALGNRSILAHPSKLEVVSQINEQIKSRDFWMPFAPTILDKDQSKYLKVKKPMAAPYMSITFDTTQEGQAKFRAAMHQYDFTLRPQILSKSWNPEYYLLVEEFRRLTGIGGVLNTSFNLHGYPIVYTPADALDVFQNSNLKYLALGSFLITK